MAGRWSRKVARNTGLEGLRFIYLRHTHATVLLTSGVPIHVVSARLGHAGIQTTVDTCGHVLHASDEETGKTIEQRLAA